MSGTGRNLVVIQRHEDILRISSVDTIPLTVKHEDIDKVRPFVDFSVFFNAAASSDNFFSAFDRHIEPDLIRIDGSLRKEMAEFESSQHCLQQILPAGDESWYFGT